MLTGPIISYDSCVTYHLGAKIRLGLIANFTPSYANPKILGENTCQKITKNPTNFGLVAKVCAHMCRISFTNRQKTIKIFLDILIFRVHVWNRQKVGVSKPKSYESYLLRHHVIPFLVFLCLLNVLFVSFLFFRKIKQFKISLIMNSNLVIHFSQL